MLGVLLFGPNLRRLLLSFLTQHALDKDSVVDDVIAGVVDAFGFNRQHAVRTEGTDTLKFVGDSQDNTHRRVDAERIGNLKVREWVPTAAAVVSVLLFHNLQAVLTGLLVKFE